MDGLHLPEIVHSRGRSGRCLSGVSKNITTGESFTGRVQRSTREGRHSKNVEKSTGKKRSSTSKREPKAPSRKASNSGKNSVQDRSQNSRKRFETIGLPKITTNTELVDGTSNVRDNSGAKKPRRTKADKGGTISYVYSKSLQDENSMAFLRNSVDFEKDFNVNYKMDKKFSFDKKPYGLPALKLNEELIINEERFLGKDLENSDGSFTETESLLNAWEAIDDESSNGTTYDSADCSTGNEEGAS